MSSSNFICRVKIISDEGSITKYTETTPFILGRSPECDIVCAGRGVSRQHIKIFIKDKNILLEDLNSSNGTLINGKKIPPGTPYPYHSGDPVTFGKSDYEITFDLMQSNLLSPNEEATLIIEGAKSKAQEIEKDAQRQIQRMLEQNKEAMLAEKSRLKLQEDAILSDSRRRADQEIKKAEEDAGKIVTEARLNVKNLQEEAAREANKIITDAQAAANEVLKNNEDRVRSEEESLREQLKKETRQALQNVKIEAQEEAEKIISRANAQAMNYKVEAEEQAEQIIAHAKSKSSDIDRERDRETEQILQEARVAAAKIRAEAQGAVDAIKEDAQAKGENIVQQGQARANDYLRQAKEQAEAAAKAQEEKFRRIQEEARDEAKNIRDKAYGEGKLITAKLQEKAEAESRDMIAKAKMSADNLIKRAENERKSLLKKAEADAQAMIQVYEDQKKSVQLKKENFEEEVGYLEKKKLQLDGDLLNLNEVILKAEEGNKDLLDQHRKYKSQAENAKGAYKKLEQDLNNLTENKSALLEELRVYQEEKENLSGDVKKAKTELELSLKEKQSIEAAKAKVLHEIELGKVDIVKAQREADQIIIKVKADVAKLKSSAENEVREKQKAVEEEILKQKKDVEINIANKLLKGDEEARKRRLKEQQADLAMKEHQAQELARNIENIILPKINNLANSGDNTGVQLTGLATEIQNLVNKVVHQDYSENAAELDEVMVFSPSMKKERKNYWISRTVFSSVALALVLSFVFYGAEIKVGINAAYVAIKGDGSASDFYSRKIASRNKVGFAPQRTTVYHSTYMDRVLYTEDYIEARLDEEIKEDWREELFAYFVKEYTLGDRFFPQFFAIENNLIKDLLKEQNEINPRFEEEGLDKMRKLQAKRLEKLKGAFPKENGKDIDVEQAFKKFEKFERKYFSKVLKKRNLEKPAKTKSN